MTDNKIDLTTLKMAEIRRLHADAAALIAEEDATKLKVAAFCDEVYDLAKQRGVTMADLVRGLAIAETGGESKIERKTPATAKQRKGGKT